MAKLQILKQNTEPPGSEPKDAPQTIQQRLNQHKRHSEANNKSNSTLRNQDNEKAREEARERSAGSAHSKNRFQIQQAKLHSVDDFVVGESYKFCKHAGQAPARNSQKYMDSGKSSDSSLSSAHNYRKIQESGSLRIGSAHSKSSNKYNPDNTYRMLQESASSHNIPDKGHLAPSLSNSLDLVSGNSGSPSHSAVTPLMKKHHHHENQAPGNNRDISTKSSKHQSFDYGPTHALSVSRSGSFMSPINSGPTARPVIQTRKGSFDGHGSDDSMHEKYFKSVESTPVSRRRHTTSSKDHLKSSDSSPQSPISPQNLVRCLFFPLFVRF